MKKIQKPISIFLILLTAFFLGRLSKEDSVGAEGLGVGLEGSPLPCQDVNGDGLADITDAIHLLSWHFVGGEAPECDDPNPTMQFLADRGASRIQVFTDGAWGFGGAGYKGVENVRIDANGEEAPHGLGVHPPSNGTSRLVYHLKGEFSRIEGRAGIDGIVPGSSTALTFDIWGDGKLLWRTGSVRSSRDLREFDVDIDGVDELTLITHCPGSNHNAHAIWIDPVLKR